jgi:hypothetical protein
MVASHAQSIVDGLGRSAASKRPSLAEQVHMLQNIGDTWIDTRMTTYLGVLDASRTELCELDESRTQREAAISTHQG